MSLRAIKRFVVPEAVVQSTERAIQEAGIARNECFVLWTGREQGEVFVVEAALIPVQQAIHSEDGVGVIVGPEAMHSINLWLAQTGRVLGAQVHSHPTDAFHSDTDDAFPIVNETGGLSLVVPDYGARGMRVDDLAVLRLTDHGWHQLSTKEAKALLPFLQSA